MASPSTATGEFRPVVVTAVTAMTSLGDSIEETWDALLAGRHGFRAIEDPQITRHGLPVTIAGTIAGDPAHQLTKVEARRLDFVEQLALVLSRQLWEKAGSPEVDKERLGVVVGTGIGGARSLIDSTRTLETAGYRKVSPHAVAMLMPNGAAANVGLAFGALAGVHTPVSACSSGNEAIADAWRMLVRGDADVVITGGVESRIHETAIAGFAQLRAMSTETDPALVSRPFDTARSGFAFGEAGAMLLLETEEHAQARGATILARVLGAGSTSDGFHIVAPHPEGLGAARAMKQAIRAAGISPTDVGHVNAHATATPIGDTAEARAITAAVGSHPSVYGPKGALGHSIGAVGALEGVLTVLSIVNEVVPPTVGLVDQDPDIDLDVVTGAPREGRIDVALNNSFGFGGHNIAVVFGRA